MKSIRFTHRLFPAGALALLIVGGCSSLPDKPTRPVSYDFGPGVATASATDTSTPSTPMALADVETAGVADTAAVTYRLLYADAQQLRPYAMARWVLPPGQLVRQRIREVLGRHRAILEADDALSQKRVDGRLPRILRLQLEAFSQVFTSPAQSEGVLRLRATVVDHTPQGESLAGQRVFVLRRPAASADAAGGVQALAAATDAAAGEIGQWLAGLPAPSAMPSPVPSRRP